jgi:hypothetical protein
MPTKDTPRHRTAGRTTVGSENTRTLALLALSVIVLVVITLWVG